MGTGGPFPGAKCGWGVTLTTHPHLVPRSRMSRSCTSSPPSATMACSGTALLFAFYLWHRPYSIKAVPLYVIEIKESENILYRAFSHLASLLRNFWISCLTYGVICKGILWDICAHLNICSLKHGSKQCKETNQQTSEHTTGFFLIQISCAVVCTASCSYRSQQSLIWASQSVSVIFFTDVSWNGIFMTTFSVTPPVPNVTRIHGVVSEIQHANMTSPLCVHSMHFGQRI
jgi:hypothetical protein